MRLLRLLHRALHPDRGQMIILFVAIFTVTMLAGAISVDLGLWLGDRRSAAKAADLAALAGSQDLPASVTDARHSAIEWARLNGWDDLDPDVTVEVSFFCSNGMELGPDSGICDGDDDNNPEPCSVNGLNDAEHCDSIKVTVKKHGTHIFSSFFGMGDINEGSAAMATLSFDLIPKDVVLVIDQSGSMIQSGNYSHGHSRLYWAKQAALAFVNELAGGSGSASFGNSHVEVITFQDRVSASRRIAFSGDANAVRRAIDNISENYDQNTATYIAPGLTMASNDLRTHVHDGSYRVVILLSDGRNWGDNGPNCTLTWQRRANTVSAISGLHAQADAVYAVSIGDETSCGTTHNQFCRWNSCNSAEIDRCLLDGPAVPVPPGPSTACYSGGQPQPAVGVATAGGYVNTEDASNLPEIFKNIAWKIAGRALTQ